MKLKEETGLDMTISRSDKNLTRRIGIIAASVMTTALTLWSAAAPPRAEKLKYNRDIRPILAENCFACHGPDSASRKAGMRLDRPEDAFRALNGHAPIVKNNPAQSEVVKRITGEGSLMPPPVTKKVLTARQIDTLKRWISDGAEYEKHWSYLPPVRPVAPAVRNTAWIRNPLDRFVLARLEKAGLTPAPEADRRTLARRLSLDLTGLPPEPTDVDAFLADKSPKAYENYVDRLMATPQWGEHRGRAWLDAARYADTHGIHFDNFREMWSYRDWVINAFNKNMPFDQFTIEQLAGDLLPKPSLDQVVATGFNRCNITSNEGGLIPEEYIVLYARDRTETTSAVWLGSTLGCAVCHDHKFDPFSTKDFYAMSAFFNNTTQGAMDGNIKDTPPILPTPMPEDRARFEALKAEIPSAREAVEARKKAARTDFDTALASGAVARSITTNAPSGLLFHAPLNEGSGRAVKALVAGKEQTVETSVAAPGWDKGHVAAKAFRRDAGATAEFPTVGDFDTGKAFSCSAWVKIPRGDTGGAIASRMDENRDYRGWDLWLEGGKVGTHLISKWPMDAVKVVARDPLSPGKWHHVCITYNGGAHKEAVSVYLDGTVRATDPQADNLVGPMKVTVPFKIGQRNATAGIDGSSIQDLRIYDRALTADEVRSIGVNSRSSYLLNKASSEITAPEKDELFTTWLTGADEGYRSVSSKLAALIREDQDIRNRGTVAHVMQEKADMPQAFVLFRGDYDKRRDKVTPATPASLPAMPSNLPLNRLGLAQWLMAKDHPLTARVTVNRFWQELFGQGIVRTPGDFGVTGDIPTNPELLDWLAVEFRDNGWDIKKFFKLLVTSATYRQAATVTPEKRLKDPNNILYSRGPRYRMDAEMIRDYALAASGLLVKKIGGPSVRPYQPDGVWEAVAMIGSNTRDYKRDTGDNLYRRGLYTFWKRAAPPASLDIFNAPNRETCTVRRERTDTPLQALVTLNDIQYVEAARNLAQRALKQGAANPVDFIAKRLLSRPLAASELTVVNRSLSQLTEYYKLHAKDADALIHEGESKPDAQIDSAKLAAWTMLTNQMMNLDEVLNK